MRRILITVILLAAAGISLTPILAQSQQLRPGDPPVASLITVSIPDDQGMVTISGAAGAVFPSAQVAIRNLYTEQIVYTQAGITGAFTARMSGTGNTPFWVSPAVSISAAQRDQPGVLPGGPGTIVYAAFPTTAAASSPVTPILIDGQLDDWQPDFDNILARRNLESLYITVNNIIPDTYYQLNLIFTLDSVTYALSFDPRILQTATLRRVTPNAADLGTMAVAAIQRDQIIEARISLAAIDESIDSVTLNRVQFAGADGTMLLEIQVDQTLPLLEETDGIVYPQGRLSGDNLVRFSLSGPLAQGASVWKARGRGNRLQFMPGENLQLQLDVMLTAPALPESLVGLRMIGEIGLQPVIGQNGVQAAGGLNNNNGWSSLLTPGGLAIDNVRGDFALGQTAVEPQQIIRRGDQLEFGLDFDLTLPDDLPPGLYVPVFHGLAQVADGDVFDWVDNGLFGRGEGISRAPLTYMPVVLNINGGDSHRLAWTLFYDNPSDGSRGILSDEDRQTVALSNRVRYDSPTYILPPSSYPIEPYLLNQMPAVYDTTTAPLIPLLTPGGRLSAQIIPPNGSIDDLGTASFAQSWLSTQGDPPLFGSRSPFGVYRLATLQPIIAAYPFEQYGEYEIRLTGNAEDVWGNRYEGGGMYHLLIAELLDLTPAFCQEHPLR